MLFYILVIISINYYLLI